MLKAKSLEELYNADIFTQRAQGIENIPKNSEIEVEENLCRNLYGLWAKVYYKGNLYYVDPSKIQLVR